jgi:hypothetical protein
MGESEESSKGCCLDGACRMIYKMWKESTNDIEETPDVLNEMSVFTRYHEKEMCRDTSH